MRVGKKILVISLLLTMLIVTANGGAGVLAQEATSTTEPAEGSIREQPPTLQEQTLLQTYYRNQLETYRAQEKTYQVAQNQLDQLQTLAALEEAVQATKQVMITRDQVLQTYFKLVRLKLIDTHGVSIEEKTAAIFDLAQLETELATHQQAMAQVTDRFGIAERTTDFVLSAARFETVQHRALCLIMFGQLQTVYDQTAALIPEVETQVQQKTTDFELAKKQRAVAEVKLLAEATQSQLDVIYREIFTVKSNQPKKFTNSDYTQLATKLQPIYARLSQMHEFIDEVIKL